MVDINYKQLNDAVNKVFFDGRHQTEPAYLDLEDEETLELASILSCKPEDLDLRIGSCVSATLEWSGTNIYSWHVGELLIWSLSDSGTAPPFSALLLALSLAAERMRQGETYSSNNYYQRLAELLGVNDTIHIDKIRASGKRTLIFWKHLNRWLTDNDYVYGRPTARQVNNWKYVSYALSQSLVRDADRKRLHRMFSDYGLSSHENLSESEINLYLHEWMAGHGPSAWLKRIWSMRELRERVVTAAVTELEHWEESVTEEAGHEAIGKRLTWAAVTKNFPKPSLNLFLVTSSESETLTLGSGSTRLANNIITDAEVFWLTALQGTELAYLEPIEKLNLGALLLISFALRGKDSNKKYMHEARGVLPLIKQSGSPLYREVSRITLFTQHLILCHEEWKDSVIKYLNTYARPGFFIRGGSGLPSQWVMFQDVELAAIPQDTIDNNLQCLVPLSEGVNIQLTGGLKLAPSMWHVKAPPEVFASDDDGLLDVELRTDDLEAKGKTLLKQGAESYNPTFLSSAEVILESANLLIAAIKRGKTKSERNISFRSAETPRRLLSTRDMELAYSLDSSLGNKWGPSAMPTENIENGCISLKGMIINGSLPEVEELEQPDEFLALSLTHKEEVSLRSYNIQPVEGIAAACILRGYHYWLCAEDSSSMTCKDCNAFQIARKKRGRRGKLGRTSNINSEQRTSEHTVHIDRITRNEVTPDIVYDALCFIRTGSWRKLQAITSSLVELPWEASVVSKALMDLGLIDIMLDNDNRRPSHWCCTPTAIVITPDGNAFLSGYRCESLLEKIKNALSEATSSYRTEHAKLSPCTHLWTLDTADKDGLASLLGKINGPLGEPVKVVESPAKMIVSALPSTREMMRHLRPIHIEDRDDIERFDPATGKWKPAKLDQPGAYRTFFMGRTYFYHDHQGKSNEANLELVKLLSARDNRVNLHGYNSESSAFECVIGCEPPGLYRRALVSCSGTLPRRENGKLIYTGVPKRLGAILMHKLYEQGQPS